MFYHEFLIILIIIGIQKYKTIENNIQYGENYIMFCSNFSKTLNCGKDLMQKIWTKEKFG